MRALSRLTLLLLALGAGAAPAQQSPASAPAATAAPAAAAAAASEGKVAWYGARFNGRRTASGQRFDAHALTMAHKTLPFGTRVKVTNLKNKRSVVLRVNDRGPTQPDRIGDVSQAAAQRLGMLRSGVVEASIEVVAEAPARPSRKAGKA